MKVILSIVLSSLISIVQGQEGFSIYGDLKSSDLKQETSIIVYDIDNQGNWACRDTTKFTGSYHMEMSTNETFLLRFKDPLGDKFLWLELDEHPGSYTMHVDFERSTHGVIRYDEDLLRYTSYLVDNETVKSLFKE